ncbi:MAG: hypothetical protein CBD58_02020, partial [bacterium TMED198]
MNRHIITIFLLLTFIFSQDSSILPMQKIAIETIQADKKISNDQLSKLLSTFEVNSIEQLSQANASNVINSLQSGNEVVNTPPVIAETLEVGMTKRFYLIDGNSFYGTIAEVDETDCTIKTDNSLSMKIPLTDILEETIEATLRNGDLVSGPVISENDELMEIKTKY